MLGQFGKYADENWKYYLNRIDENLQTNVTERIITSI